MNNAYAVGIAAGLASALMFVAGTGGPAALTVVLFMLAPLPAFIAGLGWGPAALISGGAAGLAAAAVTSGGKVALAFALSIVLPVAILGRVAHLSRDAVTDDGQTVTQWYPPGRLLMWIAGLSALLAGIALWAIGPDEATIRAAAKTAIERHAAEIKGMGPGGPFGSLDTEKMSALFVRVLPGVLASTWFAMMALNLYVGGRIVRASGRLGRSWPDLSSTDLPGAASIVLAAALIAAFTTGMPAIVAGGVASAFLFAYTLVGFAVLHAISRSSTQRPFILAIAYMAVFLLAPYGATLIVALIGLTDTIFDFRSRTRRGPGAPPNAT